MGSTFLQRYFLTYLIKFFHGAFLKQNTPSIDNNIRKRVNIMSADEEKLYSSIYIMTYAHVFMQSLLNHSSQYGINVYCVKFDRSFQQQIVCSEG